MMKKILTTLIAAVIGFTAISQDLHYWTNQFGTRSSLLGGAVVGGIKDNTAIYYNPAALAFSDSNSVSINANLYQMENIKVINAVGESKNLKALNIGSIPLLVGGRLKSKNPKMNIGYGIVTPVSFGFKGDARSSGFYPITSAIESPGDEEFTGQVNTNSELKETTGILGLSWKMGNNWSIGLSNMFAVRTHNYTSASLARMFLNNPDRTLVAINDIEAFSYTQISYIPKIGINYMHQKWSWGAALTLPGIKAYSTAKVTADVTGNKVDLFGNGRIDFSASDAQDKLKASYKYPVSLAVGGVYDGAKTRWAFTGQYFAGIDPYSIVTPEVKQFLRPQALFPAQTTDKYLQVKTAAKPVFNVAIGMEKALSEKLIFAASFRTNFSAYDSDMKNENGIKPYMATWDIYHVTTGITMNQGRHDLSIGLDTGFGSDNDYQQSVNLDSPLETNFLQGQLKVAQAKYFSIGLLLGYTYMFKR
jgi:hypothetical protein